MALAKHTPASKDEAGCQYCSLSHVTIDDGKIKSINPASVFHEECSDCQQYGPPNQTLCLFCEHLRLRHLLVCMPGPESPLNRPTRGLPWTGITIDLEDENMSHAMRSPSGEGTDGEALLCSICSVVRNGILMRHEISGEGPIIRKKPKRFSWYIRPGLESINVAYDSSEFPITLVVNYPEHAPRCVPRTIIEWDRVKGWLTECVSKHSRCEAHSTGAPTSFRLIDIRKKRLIDGDERHLFVALSYVWGQDPNATKLTATLTNIEQLKRIGGMETSQLPKTVADAIEVCSRLGIDYIWVDRLCIVQDDDEHKHQQFAEMASIYAAAHLVIVVTHGDMNTGIPGLTPRPSGLQMREEVDGLILMNQLPHFYTTTRGSDWNSRAWTYQEFVFARRRLYFTPLQMFFQCDDGVQCEDHLSLSEKGLISSDRVNRKEREWSLRSWKRHIELYTLRTLSYSSDVYNAFAGIARALIPEDDAFLCGLPKRDFNESLLWGSKQQKKRDQFQGLLIPSWSWASMQGSINWPHHENFIGTLVAWEYQGGATQPDGMPRFCKVQDDRVLRQRELFWEQKPVRSMLAGKRASTNLQTIAVSQATQSGQRLYETTDAKSFIILAIAWSQGCLEIEWPFPNLEDRSFLDLAADLEARWSSYLDLDREVVHRKPSPSDSHNQQPLGVELTQSTLKGRVQTSFFRLKHGTCPVFKWIEHAMEVVGEDEKLVGSLYRIEGENRDQIVLSTRIQLIALSLGSLPAHELSPVYTTSIKDCEHWNGNEYLPSERHDLKGLLAKIPQTCAALGPDGLDVAYADADGSILMDIPIVNVMLIRWDGPVARRVAIGWVFLTTWVKSNPQFQTVYLD